MIFERAQFEPITWDELEAELKENGHPGDYERNPVLANNYGSKTYCKINASGKLQVGPYERTDNFIPGCQLFISYPRRPWG